MKLYVCYGPGTGAPAGRPPVRHAYHALKDAGHDPR